LLFISGWVFSQSPPTVTSGEQTKNTCVTCAAPRGARRPTARRRNLLRATWVRHSPSAVRNSQPRKSARVSVYRQRRSRLGPEHLSVLLGSVGACHGSEYFGLWPGNRERAHFGSILQEPLGGSASLDQGRSPPTTPGLARAIRVDRAAAVLRATRVPNAPEHTEFPSAAATALHGPGTGARLW